jgi:4-hydroxy-4-methyl-2-oxoglutarate aldolase
MNSRPTLTTSSSYQEICERLSKLSTSTICYADINVRMMDSKIKSINQNSCIGPAYTVHSNQSSVSTVEAESDDLAKFLISINWDMDDIRPILVIAACGATNALAGEICVTAAKENGFGGIVLDGNYRDVVKVEESKFPFFAVGICAKPGQKRQGTIKQPIECGGVTVTPGDIIFADRDGIVVMNKAEAVYAIEKGEAIDLKEEKVLERLRQGVKLNQMYEIDEPDQIQSNNSSRHGF